MFLLLNIVLLIHLLPGTLTDDADYHRIQGWKVVESFGGKQAGQWDKVESILFCDRSFEDPFRDIEIEARFVSPAGKAVNCKGFYDDKRHWRIRFMPDVKGTWHFEVYTTKGDKLESGKFECISSDLPGIISAYEKNPTWFGYRYGKPVLIRSLHIGDCFFADQDNELSSRKWNDEKRIEFLDWAQDQGYNMLSIASHYLNRQVENRGLGWNTPDLWDEKTQRPHPEEYQRMEAILDELQWRNMLVYPFAGFFGRASDFPKDEAAQDLYIEYTIARLGAYRNLFFMLGGPEPLLPNKTYLTEQELDRIAGKIKEEDVYDHLFSTHNYTGDDLFIDSPWSSYGILQGPKTTDRKELSAGILRNLRPGRPLYLQETLWPGNTFGHPDYSLDDVRKNALVMILSGGSINFGDMDGSSSSGFSGTIQMSEKVQERHDVIHQVWDFIESLPYYEMTPHPELVSSGYCLAEPGVQYLVYLEEPAILDIDLLPGNYTGQWINARSFQVESTVDQISSGNGLIPPCEKPDWILYLRSEK